MDELTNAQSAIKTSSFVSRETQSTRLLELHDLALESGNLSVVSQTLKQLTELHGLSKIDSSTEKIETLTDNELDRQIKDLLRETGLIQTPTTSEN